MKNWLLVLIQVQTLINIKEKCVFSSSILNLALSFLLIRWVDVCFSRIQKSMPNLNFRLPVNAIASSIPIPSHGLSALLLFKCNYYVSSFVMFGRLALEWVYGLFLCSGRFQVVVKVLKVRVTRSKVCNKYSRNLNYETTQTKEVWSISHEDASQ